MREFEIEVDGTVASGTLCSDAAPVASERMWGALPLAGPLTHSKRSGSCVEFRCAELVDAGLRVENQVSFLRPGMLTYRPSTGVLMLAYGEGQARDETGAHWVCHLGDIADNLSALAQRLEATRSRSASTVTVRRRV